MFYSHRYDNLKILGLLLRAWRTQKNLRQEELAKELGVPRGLVNAAENFYSVLNSKKDARKVTREILLRILLGLKPDDLVKKSDLTLWLFDGQFLEDWERLKFLKEQAKGHKSDYRNHPREAVVDLLKEALVVYERPAKKLRLSPTEPVEIVGYRDSHEEKEDAIGKVLLEMEQGEGVRLLVRSLPSFVILKNLELKDGKIEKRQRRHQTSIDRVETFFSRIENFGERSIHEKNAILTYLQSDTPDIPMERKRRQIEVLIKLMEDNEKYQIRLVEHNPPFIFQISGLNTVLIAPPQYMRHLIGDKKDEYAKSYTKRIKLSGEEYVLPFIIEFETCWNELLKSQKTNADVIKILRDMLKQAPE